MRGVWEVVDFFEGGPVFLDLMGESHAVGCEGRADSHRDSDGASRVATGDWRTRVSVEARRELLHDSSVRSSTLFQVPYKTGTKNVTCGAFSP